VEYYISYFIAVAAGVYLHVERRGILDETRRAVTICDVGPKIQDVKHLIDRDHPLLSGKHGGHMYSSLIMAGLFGCLYFHSLPVSARECCWRLAFLLAVE
jgi:hypothetical protein